MNNNAPIMVIGSNSFSGASLSRYLINHGHSVIGISRSPEAHPGFLPYRWAATPTSFTFYQLDINKGLEQILALVHECKPSYIVNFAAQSMVAQSWEQPDHWYQTNTVAISKLMEGLRRCAFLKKYVHVSTPEVYGNCIGTIKEHTDYHPSTPYAISRAAADMHLMALYQAYQFPVVFTRAANVFGPGQQLYRIIPRTILSIKQGQKLQLHGGGVSRRSFIHIDDVADATLRIMQQGVAGNIYHISTQRIISIRELVEMICKRMNAAFDDCVEMADERLGKDGAYLLDSSKLNKELHWQDRISLEKGIDQTMDWVDQWFDELITQPQNYQHKP